MHQIQRIIICSLLLQMGISIRADNEHPNASLHPVLNSMQNSIKIKMGLCSDVYEKVCNGCHELLTCLGNTDPVNSENCALTNRPYCLSGACSINPPDPDCVQTPSVICTGPGYYPHPTNCRQFNLCSDAGGESRTYECPPRFVYNPETERCKFKWWPSDCKQVTCPAGQSDRNVAYPGSPGLYALCVNGSPVMFRCPDAVNFAFSSASGQCELKCRQLGRVPDPSDCQAYYECSQNGLQITSLRWQCVNGYQYSDVAKKCVRGSCGADISKVPPTI